MQVIGHRGSAGTSPENTIASALTAVSAGAPWLEIDVRCVAGELFVIHDETLERTTNGNGSIYRLSTTEIRAIDAGNGEKIPTLAEIIEVLDAKTQLNIELKDCESMPVALALVASLLSKYPAWHGKLMFSTFEQSIHSALAQSLPEGCLLGILLQDIPDNIVEYALNLGAYSLNLAYAQTKPALIEKAQAAGLKVFVYTVNDESQIKVCTDLKVDAIYTDFPERTLRFLKAIDSRNHG